MPGPVPPPPPNSRPEPPEQDAGHNEDLGNAALLQIAMQVIEVAGQVPDPRVQRIKKAVLDELQGSGAVELLLKVLARQQKPVEDRVADERERNRQEQMHGFWQSMQESRAKRQEHTQQINQLTDKLYQQLLDRFMSQGFTPENQANEQRAEQPPPQ